MIMLQFFNHHLIYQIQSITDDVGYNFKPWIDPNWLLVIGKSIASIPLLITICFISSMQDGFSCWT